MGKTEELLLQAQFLEAHTFRHNPRLAKEMTF
jgi:hypothetical protein